jgi:hypothetical protein
MATTSRIVPALSSGTAGPLGAIHLPRLWLKLTLDNVKALPEDYDHCGMGFDQMTLTNLNLDRDKAIAFVRSQKPTYMQFEKWVLDQNGGSIDVEHIRKHNEAIRAYNHSAELAESMRAASGIEDGTICDAVTLNTIEDLDEIHRVATNP